MPITITVPNASGAAFPAEVYAPVVEIKACWGDEWEFAPDLELVEAVTAAAGQDLGRCELRRRYGNLKRVHEADLSTQTPTDLEDYWVRIRFVTGTGLTEQWIGQICNESRAVYGAAPEQSGVQTWTAYEPLHILRKAQVGKSFWMDDGDPANLIRKEIGWMPSFNGRDGRQMLVGNRSDTKYSTYSSYLFGGTPGAAGNLWSRYDAVEYILKQFVDESAGNGPSWRLHGQANLLKSLTDHVVVNTGESVAAVLRRLIPMRLGLDYTIVHLMTGFAIDVYVLAAEEWRFGGVTLPRNERRVTLDTRTSPNVLKTHVVNTHDQRYRRIEILGRRIVVCCSLLGQYVAGNASLLSPRWTSALETAYKAGTGNDADSAEEHDRIRQNDRFRGVYQHFGAPSNWDHQGGAASPQVDAEGNLNPPGVPGGPLVGAYQNLAKRTLDYLPLREGVDYSNGGEVDSNPSGHEPDFMPPSVWVYDDTIEGAEGYVPVDSVGVHVSTPQTWLGIVLSVASGLNHYLAYNYFDSKAAGTGDSATEPVYDYGALAATLAFEADQRLSMKYENPFAAALTSGGGETMIVEDRDAEMWILAPNTVVGVDASGELQTSGPVARVLRNDSERMALLMAGALSRYYWARSRAEVVLKGLLPWGNLLGHILEIVDQNNDLNTMLAPIVSVQWRVDGNAPTTTIRTGFAR